MLGTADAVVIGGGILGTSTAHFLAKKGFGRVVLLEKRSLAAVSTGHSAAVVRTFYSNPLTVKLATRALQMFECSQEALGGDCGFRQVGYLCLLDEKTASAGAQILQVERDGQTRQMAVSPVEIGEIAPDLRLDQVAGGIFEPRSGFVDPVRTTRNLADRAKPWGLSLCEGVGATGIRLAGCRVTGVETEDGVIETPVAVNAAGPWGRRIGLTADLNCSIRWSRESDLVLRLPPGVRPFPVVSDSGLRVYFRPHGEGEILAGLTPHKEIEPLDIDDYDPSLDEKTRRRIERGLLQRMPALGAADSIGGWASIYTITDDWHPLVGPEPGLEGYYACFGGSGHGFKLGPPIGEALSDVIAGDAPEIDIHALRPNRFIDGEIFTSAWGGGNRA